MKLSVAGISLRDGKYFIARRLPGGDMGGKWEFPGGKVETGESREEALRREYDEEFGVAIRVRLPICEVDFRHNDQMYRLCAYSVDIIAPVEVFRLVEHSEQRWASLEEIMELDFADSDRKILPYLL